MPELGSANLYQSPSNIPTTGSFKDYLASQYPGVASWTPVGPLPNSGQTLFGTTEGGVVNPGVGTEWEGMLNGQPIFVAGPSQLTDANPFSGGGSSGSSSGSSFAAATAPATSGAISPTADPLMSLFNQYFGGGAAGTGTPGGSGGGSTSPASSNVQDFLTKAENQFIPEMLSQNYRSTPAGSAAFESAAGPINAKYDALKQQVIQNAGQQGVSPSSGIVQDQINQVEMQRTQALSGLEQQFNAQLPQREQAGISQLTNLMGINQQQQLQSLGVQQSLDEAQRQRLLDAATLAGNQGAAAAENAAGTAGNLLGAASNLAGQYYNQGAQQAQGLGSMMGSMGNFFNQPQTSTLYGGANAWNTSNYIPQTTNQAGDIFQGSAPAMWGGGAIY